MVKTMSRKKGEYLTTKNVNRVTWDGGENDKEGGFGDFGQEKRGQKLNFRGSNSIGEEGDKWKGTPYAETALREKGEGEKGEGKTGGVEFLRRWEKRPRSGKWEIFGALGPSRGD